MPIADLTAELDAPHDECERNLVFASSIDDYLRICIYVAERANEQIWYRGHRGRHALTPSLYRTLTPTFDARGNPVGRGFHGTSEGIVYEYPNYNNMLNAFKRQAVPYLKHRPIDDFEWMFIMQHHGIPTRLLDWSTDPLTALYFATNRNNTDDVYGEDDAEIWLMDPIAVNMKLHNIPGIAHLSEPEWSECLTGDALFPLCAYSSHVDERIRAQNGVFTLHGNLLKPLSYYHPISNDFLIIVIPSDRVSKIRNDLRRIGYDHARMFPGIETLAPAIVASEMRRYNMWREQRPTQAQIMAQEFPSKK